MDQYRITTIVATSPVPRIPSITHLTQTIDSLEFVPELARSPIFVVFDASRENRSSLDYALYKRNVEKYYHNKLNISFMHLSDWGHLSGVMEHAFEYVATPFIFAQQHDLPLVRWFDLDKVLECLSKDELVKHIRLNRRANRAVGWDKTPLFGSYDNPYVPLTRTGCWSDQSHLTTANYYRDTVLPEIKGKRVFMEQILNPRLQLHDKEALGAAHRWLGTFLYGLPNSPPVIKHTDARNQE